MPEWLFILVFPHTVRKRVSSNRNKAMEEDYERQWTQAAIREMPMRSCERHFLKKGGQTPEQFAQRSCGSSIPGDTQNSDGWISPPSWSCFQQGFGADDLQRSLPTSIIPILPCAYQKQKPVWCCSSLIQPLWHSPSKEFPFPHLLVSASNNEIQSRSSFQNYP